MVTVNITEMLRETLKIILAVAARVPGAGNALPKRESSADAEPGTATPLQRGLLAPEAGDRHERATIAQMEAADNEALWRFARESDLRRRIKAAGLVV